MFLVRANLLADRQGVRCGRGAASLIWLSGRTDQKPGTDVKNNILFLSTAFLRLEK